MGAEIGDANGTPFGEQAARLAQGISVHRLAAGDGTVFAGNLTTWLSGR